MNDKLGEDIYRLAGDEGYIEVPKILLEGKNLRFNSEEYCDWLTKHKLRQYKVRKHVIHIGRQKYNE